MGKTTRFRSSNQQIIRTDTHSVKEKQRPQEKLTLYYCLALKQYDIPHIRSIFKTFLIIMN